MHEALPRAVVVHTIPGRSRLRIAGRRGDSVFFASLASGLSTFQGITGVEVSPLTGSVLVQHEKPLDVVAKAARDARLFALDSAPTEQATAAIEALPFDFQKMAALVFVALALLQVGRGQILPQAATLAWYAGTLLGLVALAPAPAAGADSTANVDD